MPAVNLGADIIVALAGGDAAASAVRTTTTCREAESQPISVAMPRMSYFLGPIANVRPLPGFMRLVGLWHIITGRGPDGGSGYPQLRGQVEALRAAPKHEQVRLKRALDYVTPAGTFAPTRANANLQEASHLLVLDFDDLPDVAASRKLLLGDSMLGPEIALLFISPSGTGLKAFLRLDPAYGYAQNFDTVAAYLAHHHAGLQVALDAKCRDVSRACFLSFDPDAYLHPDYQID